MQDKRFTLDTNILVYAVDRDAGDRHGTAIDLVDKAVQQDCILTLQALSEFFYAVTRKGKMPSVDAAEQVRDWQTLFPVVAAQPDVLSRAFSAVEDHGLAFWDAMLWATAKTAGVTVLLSEDFQDGRDLQGVRFRNPFAGDQPFWS